MDAEPPSPRTSPYPPAEARRRLAARLIDLLLPVALIAVSPPGGPRIAFTLFAGALMLCGDSLSGPGRSLGKRLFGLRTIVVESRRPAPTLDGMKRNLIFALAVLPGLLPNGLARWEALLTLGAVLALEAIFAVRPLPRDLGQRRIGDLWAGTQVIDASIAIQLPAPMPVRARRALAPQPPAVRHERPAARIDSPPPATSSRKPDVSEETACASH